MLGSTGFDLWADGYDRSVGLSDEDGTYPFTGYRNLLNEIFNRVLALPGRDVLDIGFGTGVLTSRLYERGFRVWGQDFSPKMTALAQTKMPDAKLYESDFAQGLVSALTENKYDAIVATYSLHHLTDAQKAVLLEELLPLLRSDGCIYIGDVAFETRAELERCRTQAGDEWDDEEIYFVFDEWRERFPQMRFEKFSPCAGLLTLTAPSVH